MLKPPKDKPYWPKMMAFLGMTEEEQEREEVKALTWCRENRLTYSLKEKKPMIWLALEEYWNHLVKEEEEQTGKEEVCH